jgi:hypothetical protein
MPVLLDMSALELEGQTLMFQLNLAQAMYQQIGSLQFTQMFSEFLKAREIAS